MCIFTPHWTVLWCQPIHVFTIGANWWFYFPNKWMPFCVTISTLESFFDLVPFALEKMFIIVSTFFQYTYYHANDKLKNPTHTHTSKWSWDNHWKSTIHHVYCKYICPSCWILDWIHILPWLIPRTSCLTQTH